MAPRDNKRRVHSASREIKNTHAQPLDAALEAVDMRLFHNKILQFHQPATRSLWLATYAACEAEET
jgi:hypothetical protein